MTAPSATTGKLEDRCRGPSPHPDSWRFFLPMLRVVSAQIVQEEISGYLQGRAKAASTQAILKRCIASVSDTFAPILSSNTTQEAASVSANNVMVNCLED